MAQLLNVRQLSRIGEDSNPSTPTADVSVNSHLAGIRRSAVLSHSVLTADFNAQSLV